VTSAFIGLGGVYFLGIMQFVILLPLSVGAAVLSGRISELPPASKGLSNAITPRNALELAMMVGVVGSFIWLVIVLW
jgi:hypothetical protein